MGYLDKDGLQHYHTALQPSLVRSVTQAEYDLLTEEQKKGLFVITDAQSGDSGTEDDTGAGSCGEVYSTEETRIGTWIDGKPLYRRVYEITTPAQDTDSYQTYGDIPSYCENVRAYGFMIDRWGMYLPIPQYWDPNIYISIGIIPGAILGIRCRGQNNLSRPATIILEYTKTTDETVSR